MLSYTTSPAYHVEFEKTTRYQAAVFADGHYAQVEGLGITAGARHLELARKFVDFALTEAFQKEIPLTNWMYPVVPATALPDSYKHAPRPRAFSRWTQRPSPPTRSAGSRRGQGR